MVKNSVDFLMPLTIVVNLKKFVGSEFPNKEKFAEKG